ncbi:AI-2E family transporter [Micromonospora craniellae]|uniref:AI-2E family transporter n=1 Tax=Micromonospora craniellae TaxID=2294034 RepID=A0A372FU73_9ACTN|nr:AI-2E family transporter [Micromonospora craniellae]QOC93972.1 AI-2E family transporter [Micromonospora craniellae]RFS44039.1 AI-2E family transporter [Micromonospora craniellae]
MVARGGGRTPEESTRRGAGPRQTWAALPWLVRTAVVWSACLVVIAAGLYLLARITLLVTPLAIALAATFFLAALLDPVQLALRRLRLPAALAALLTVLLLLGVLFGVGLLVWNMTASQFSELGDELREGLERSRDFVTSTLPVTDEQLDGLVGQLRQALSQQEVDPVASAQTVAEVFGSVLLALVLLFFLLKDGRSMWHWTLRRAGGPNREIAAKAGRVGWRTLGSYSRGTMLIAAIDAIGIGLALVLLGVPLAFPLALITFFGGFVPIIGATVAGAVAVLVALAANGPTTALLTLAAVIAVQQIEGNLLEPLVMKRQVRLHPVVILLAVTAGTLIAGIAGAFVAVPIAAVVWRVIDSVQQQRQVAASRRRWTRIIRGRTAQARARRTVRKV